jgi:RNA polymerase sigma-70 factor (ECF subfamily)
MTTPRANGVSSTSSKTATSAVEAPNFKREMLATLPSLRAFAVSLSGRHDKADDLVQDTVMKAWAKQDSFELGTNIKAWLFTILRNEFYSQMRKRGREVQDSDGLFTERMAVHPSQYGSMDMADFKKALDRLPDDQREAIVLIGASGFSYEEAAEICNCAIGTMKSRVSRARTRLQQDLQVTGESDYGPDGISAQVANNTFSS